MATTKKASELKPNSLSIVRSGNKFTCQWKRGSEKYTEQFFWYYLNGSTKGTKVNVGKNDLKKVIELNFDSFRPTTNTALSSFKFEVGGHVKDGRIFYAAKSVSLYAPLTPELTTTPDSLPNACNFAWKVPSDNYERPFVNVKWQSMLIADNFETDGSKLTWTSDNPYWQEGTSANVEDNVDITEQTSVINTGSHTRWFRIQSRGPKGESAWVYSSRVYSEAQQTTNTRARAEKTSTGYKVTVAWDAGANTAYPVDQMDIKYVIGKPTAGMGIPSESWTTAQSLRRASTANEYSFDIEGFLDDDECLWVRVDSVFDNRTSTGEPQLVMIGYLADPEDLSVGSIVESTHRATITATNKSQVVDSHLAIVYQTNEDAPFVIGVIPHGETSFTVTAPDWTGKTRNFGVYAFVGDYSQDSRTDGVTSFTVNAKMRSENTVRSGGTVPLAPTQIEATQVDSGTIRVNWNWPWSDADRAIISWADHADAWESTDDPDEYVVSNVYASQWNIHGLDVGKTWWVAVRLAYGDTYSPWSEKVSVNLSTVPTKPKLSISNGVITAKGSFTLAWQYSNDDGTKQAHADIYELIDGNYVPLLTDVQTAQQVTIYAEKQGWTAGTTRTLKVRVRSTSGMESDWSAPVSVIIAEELTARITSHSLNLVHTDEGDQYHLQELPLTASVTGATTGGTASIAIKRVGDYDLTRPDGKRVGGYDGETFAVRNIQGNGSVSFGELGLEDGGKYELKVVVKDSYGQTDSTSILFWVHWSHQAVTPFANVLIDREELAAFITPIALDGISQTDRCDIYRLSADSPELVYEGAEFGQTYVDPYPAINGGYRLVTVTKDGDYTTADGGLAWQDIDTEFDYDHSIIDFDGNTLRLLYNLDLQNNWEKRVQITEYLDGTVEADYDEAIERTTTLSTVAFTEYNAEVVAGLRALAEYTGKCHIRNLDGSSFTADLQVSEDRDHDDRNVKAGFSISGTRVDSDGPEGMPLSEWVSRNELG